MCETALNRAAQKTVKKKKQSLGEILISSETEDL